MLPVSRWHSEMEKRGTSLLRLGRPQPQQGWAGSTRAAKSLPMPHACRDASLMCAGAAAPGSTAPCLSTHLGSFWCTRLPTHHGSQQTCWSGSPRPRARLWAALQEQRESLFTPLCVPPYMLLTHRSPAIRVSLSAFLSDIFSLYITFLLVWHQWESVWWKW